MPAAWLDLAAMLRPSFLAHPLFVSHEPIEMSQHGQLLYVFVALMHDVQGISGPVKCRACLAGTGQGSKQQASQHEHEHEHEHHYFFYC
jgi:hypothetical protein